MVNHVKTVNTTVIKQRVKAKHGSAIIVLSEFIDWGTKMDFKCTSCKDVWQSKPQNVCNGSRCPTCGRAAARQAMSTTKRASAKAQQRIKANTTALRIKLRRQKVLWIEGEPRGSMSVIQLECKPCGFEFERQVRHILWTDALCPCCHDTTYREMLKQSPIADRWLDSVEHKLGRTLKREVHIPGTLYRADGFDPKTHTVYEFYGDAWHGNPAVYHPNQSCHPFKKVKARELYAATLAKEETLKGLGYNVVSIWESTYKSSNV